MDLDIVNARSLVKAILAEAVFIGEVANYQLSDNTVLMCVIAVFILAYALVFWASWKVYEVCQEPDPGFLGIPGMTPKEFMALYAQTKAVADASLPRGERFVVWSKHKSQVPGKSSWN